MRLIWKKIKNKTGLTICLLLGLIFLIGTISCFPMYEDGAVNYMLQNEFESVIEKKNVYPMMISDEEESSIDEFADKVEAKRNTYKNAFAGIDRINGFCELGINHVPAKGTLLAGGLSAAFSYVPDIENHIKMYEGKFYNEMPDDGNIYCVVSQKTADISKIAVGETIECFNALDENGEMLRIQVCGIFDVADDKDLFWVTSPNGSEAKFYLTPESLKRVIKNNSSMTPKYVMYELYDYHDVNAKNAKEITNKMPELRKASQRFKINFNSVLDTYKSGKGTIKVSMWVLQIPILGMIIGFIFMVSNQILESEKNELSMFHSRGIMRGQIMLNYTIQTVIIAGFAFVLGVPVGYLLCKIAASSADFLKFDTAISAVYTANIRMIPYGLAATLLGVIVIVIPAIKYSNITIVQHKADGISIKKMFWEKAFLDIIILIATVYLMYNYYKGYENVRKAALTATKMDPMIFMDTILFIIAGGLFVLRLSNLFVKLVYRLGINKWKPAVYSSFLQITRNFRKQCAISIFMILTVAMGLFYANAARTVNGNKENRIEYNLGADVRITPFWDYEIIFVDDSQYSDGAFDYNYIEPDYLAYEKLVKDGLCDKVTRVISSNDLIVTKGNKIFTDCQLLGIKTKELGETALFRDEFNKNEFWYIYLNALAEKGNGAVISKNLADDLELKVGSKIDISKYGDYSVQKDKIRGKMEVEVVAIVENWPTYISSYYADDMDKNRYMVVINYATAVNCFKQLPYDVFIRLSKGVSADQVYSALKDNGVTYASAKSVAQEKQNLRKEYILQITNGLFTLSFIISIILCMIGFLIYWIASITQRQLLFGVYRAMGMSVKDINRMLVNEHLFSTLPSVIIGTIVGFVASLLFTKLFAVIYLPEKHNLGLLIHYELQDYIKLFGIVGLGIIVCVLALRRLVGKLDISKALKLGED